MPGRSVIAASFAKAVARVGSITPSETQIHMLGSVGSANHLEPGTAWYDPLAAKNQHRDLPRLGRVVGRVPAESDHPAGLGDA
jgi:hypothetical protein